MRTVSNPRLWMACALGSALAVGACGGEDGATGAEGPEGPEGADGPRGAEGPEGPAGRDGDQGESGAEGAPGADGVAADAGMIPESANGLRFDSVAFARTAAEKRAATASAAVWLGNEKIELGGYKTLLRSGDTPGDSQHPWGLILDQNGDPVKVAGEDYVSDAADFSSLLPVGDKLFSVTHFESRPGGMYLTELAQDEEGELSAVSTKPLDFADWDGLWVPCAGSVTPWATHLGSEEYPPDARLYAEMASDEDLFVNYGSYGYDSGMYRYFGIDIDTDADDDGIPDNATLADVKAAFNPYAYGYPVEVAVSEAGDPTVTKHYAMGRVALELAYVMPDEKTVYLSDDGTNVGFFMFIADEAGDLSAGTLYAAKWVQTHDGGAGAADLEWISMGHADQAAVDALIHADEVEFPDIFETEAPDMGACPTEGFMHTIANGSEECLKLKDGMEVAASRLETRRYADYLGATLEFRKEEGITFDPDSMTLFVAMSEVGSGMVDDGSKDFGGRNDIRLEENPCGAVYALDVGQDDVIGSQYVAADWYTVIAGAPVEYAVGSPYESNTCSINGIANPDNLTFIRGQRTLIIGEDTGSGHQNDAVWSMNLDSGKLTRILTTPYGSETTSPYWYPNIGGFAYLKTVIQHPYGESDSDEAPDDAARAAYDGYIGPFPAMD